MSALSQGIRFCFLCLAFVVCGASQRTIISYTPPSQKGIQTQEVILQGLNKVTARVFTINAKVDEEIQFQNLRILVKDCRMAPPEDPPETVAFLEIDEVTPDQIRRRVFSGWMFASNPSIHALQHPVYDVWVKEGVVVGDNEQKSQDEEEREANPSTEASENKAESKEADKGAKPKDAASGICDLKEGEPLTEEQMDGCIDDQVSAILSRLKSDQKEANPPTDKEERENKEEIAKEEVRDNEDEREINREGEEGPESATP